MRIQGLHYKKDTQGLSIDDWFIEPEQHWGVFTTRAQTAQLLSRVFMQDIPGMADVLSDIPPSVAVVSLALQ